MKLTKQTLRQLIKETIKEMVDRPEDYNEMRSFLASLTPRIQREIEEMDIDFAVDFLKTEFPNELDLWTRDEIREFLWAEADESNIDQYYDDSMDGDAESALASAGWGTDEDYGDYGSGDDW